MAKFLFRLVELDKLRLGTRKEEAKELAAKGGVDPYIVLQPASASRGGVSEKLVRVCEECREEFCSGNCIIFQYDSYQVCSYKTVKNHPIVINLITKYVLCLQRLIKETNEDDSENLDETSKKKKKRSKSAKKKK